MRRTGFSLLELLLVVLIIGILSAIVYPAYQQYILRSYRAEAITTLLELANRQAIFLADFGEYQADLVKLGIASAETVSGRYRVEITLSDNNQAYQMLLIAQGPQQQDNECRRFTLNQLGQRNHELSEPLSCWY